MDISCRIRIPRKSSLLRIIVVIAILVLGTVTILWSAQSCLQIRSVEASLFVELKNDANYTFDLSGFIYVYGEEPIQFINTDIVKIHGENLTVVEIEDGSGVQLYMPQFKPGESIEVQINKIQVGETLHQRVYSLRFDPTFHFINETDIGYKAIFRIIGKMEIGTISAASKYIFTVRLAEKNVLIESESRKNVLEYLKALHLIVFVTLVGFCFSFFSQRIKEWFPFITLIFIMLTIFVYVYIGSGREINYMYNMKNFRLLAFVPFLVHGYYGHITNNLVYFALLSVLMETICLHNGKKLRKFAQWYLPPLAALSLFHGLQFLATGKFGFGLSFVIQVMTWVLWAHILKDFRSIVTSRVRVFMVILSGIPSVVFLGWLISYLLFPTRNPYYKNLAEGHIQFGIASAIIVFLVVFREETIRSLKSFASHMRKKQALYFVILILTSFLVWVKFPSNILLQCPPIRKEIKLSQSVSIDVFGAVVPTLISVLMIACLLHSRRFPKRRYFRGLLLATGLCIIISLPFTLPAQTVLVPYSLLDVILSLLSLHMAFNGLNTYRKTTRTNFINALLIIFSYACLSCLLTDIILLLSLIASAPVTWFYIGGAGTRDAILLAPIFSIVTLIFAMSLLQVLVPFAEKMKTMAKLQNRTSN